MDPRDSNRGTRKKSKWVQELIKEDTVVTPEAEHVVGRDQSEAMSAKSTTDASSAHVTKKSATDAPNSRKEKEDTAMEVELANKLNEIQQEIDSNQKKQLNILNQIFSKAKDVIEQDKVKIATLTADNKYYERLAEDVVELKQQLRTYKLLFWGTIGTLTVLLIIFLLLT